MMESREERLKNIAAARAAGQPRPVIVTEEVLERILQNQLLLMERFNMTDVDTQVLIRRMQDVRANRQTI